MADRSPVLPSYDELPMLTGLGLPHSWDLFDPHLGTLSLLTPDRVAAAAHAVRTGERISLTLPLNQPDPPLFGRRPLRHELTESDRNSWDDALQDFYPQASSQWDGFLHIRAREFGFFGGRTDSPRHGEPHPGVLAWSEGIIGRGVLLDVAGWRAARGDAVEPLSGREIPAHELAATAAAQGVELRTGDVLCVRTGWQTAYSELDESGRKELADPASGSGWDGLEAGPETARFVWDHHVAALLADNPAVESSPGDPSKGSLHRQLLAALGLPFGELLAFDELTAHCRARGAWDFLFVAVPLALPGGIASPANAIAIV